MDHHQSYRVTPERETGEEQEQSHVGNRTKCTWLSTIFTLFDKCGVDWDLRGYLSLSSPQHVPLAAVVGCR